MTRDIVHTDDTCGGAPRIDGTRLTCANVVLPLGMHNESLNRYLSIYDYLTESDIKECVRYCSEQLCVIDGVSNFCQGCSLDQRKSPPCENPDAPFDAPVVEYTEEFEDESIDVWKYAQALVKKWENT